jgi:hypothetical protein
LRGSRRSAIVEAIIKSFQLLLVVERRMRWRWWRRYCHRRKHDIGTRHGMVSGLVWFHKLASEKSTGVCPKRHNSIEERG